MAEGYGRAGGEKKFNTFFSPLIAKSVAAEPTDTAGPLYLVFNGAVQEDLNIGTQ